MKQFKYVITDEVGLHARPAGLLAKKAKEMKGADVTVTVSCNGKSADATKLMAIMGMGVKKDMEVEVTVEGGDEEAACHGGAVLLLRSAAGVVDAVQHVIEEG